MPDSYNPLENRLTAVSVKFIGTFLECFVIKYVKLPLPLVNVDAHNAILLWLYNISAHWSQALKRYCICNLPDCCCALNSGEKKKKKQQQQQQQQFELVIKFAS